LRWCLSQQELTRDAQFITHPCHSRRPSAHPISGKVLAPSRAWIQRDQEHVLLYRFAPLAATGFEPVVSGEKNTVLLLVPKDRGQRRLLSSLTHPERKWEYDSHTSAIQVLTTRNRTMVNDS
jgi:hypothetical protein